MIEKEGRVFVLALGKHEQQWVLNSGPHTCQVGLLANELFPGAMTSVCPADFFFCKENCKAITAE